MAERDRLILPKVSQEYLATHLYKEGLFAIKENPDDYTTMRSGRRSPHYFDLGPGLSNPKTRKLVGGALLSLAVVKDHRSLDERYDHFVNVTEGMSAYATTTADEASMSLLQPNANFYRAWGSEARIFGRYTHGDRVAALGDVITDGVTNTAKIAALESRGLRVADYYVVLDREEGGATEVETTTGISITPALGLSTAVSILRANSLIGETQYDNVAEYIAEYGDPHAVAELSAA